MNTKMYVGNLSFDATEADLRDLFGQYGGVTEVFLPTDRDSGRPRGFAFISMDSVEAMNSAVENLHSKPFLGRNLTVNEARPREERPAFSNQRRSGGGGGGGGGGGFDRNRRSGGGGGGGYDRDRSNRY